MGLFIGEWREHAEDVIRDMDQKLVELRGALAPFAKYAEYILMTHGDRPHDAVVCGPFEHHVTYGDLRRALLIMKTTGE